MFRAPNLNLLHQFMSLRKSAENCTAAPERPASYFQQLKHQEVNPNFYDQDTSEEWQK
jgi:hypothetical protein